MPLIAVELEGAVEWRSQAEGQAGFLEEVMLELEPVGADGWW